MVYPGCEIHGLGLQHPRLRKPVVFETGGEVRWGS